MTQPTIQISAPVRNREKYLPYYLDGILSQNYPKDKIAIIDIITMTHTRPVGQNYDRFPRNPWEEMNELLYSYNIKKEEIVYSKIKLK
jgi:cellulose synthase/poly-beta-1,6-N-acetylglucosamine synthase-like glycosyltransferase